MTQWFLVAETWGSKNTLIVLYAIVITAGIREKQTKSTYPMPDWALIPSEILDYLSSLFLWGHWDLIIASKAFWGAWFKHNYSHKYCDSTMGTGKPEGLPLCRAKHRPQGCENYMPVPKIEDKVTVWPNLAPSLGEKPGVTWMGVHEPLPSGWRRKGSWAQV